MPKTKTLEEKIAILGEFHRKEIQKALLAAPLEEALPAIKSGLYGTHDWRTVQVKGRDLLKCNHENCERIVPWSWDAIHMVDCLWWK